MNIIGAIISSILGSPQKDGDKFYFVDTKPIAFGVIGGALILLVAVVIVAWRHK